LRISQTGAAPPGGAVLMGILNCTPDSFAGPKRWQSLNEQVDQAAKQVDAGAHWLDVGGESTRPGAPAIGAAEEIDRVLPLLEALRNSGLSARLSIDTHKAAVAEVALRAGASMVNDVSALGDPAMPEVVRAAGAQIILMHCQGSPATMQKRPQYGHVVREVAGFLADRTQRACAAGIPRTQIYVDPGFGFGKSLAHNVQLLAQLAQLRALGQPLCVGLSRKSFLGELTGQPQPQDRDPASAAALTAAVLAGATLLRVHEVEAMRDALAVANALRDLAKPPAVAIDIKVGARSSSG
jgi:dihydropteroate synthase